MSNDVSHLIPKTNHQIPLQPLRIPTGWKVAYNNGLYEIDPLPELVPEEDSWWLFKEDMLALTNDRLNRLIDLGWYPEGDLVQGHYGLAVYEGDFQGKLLLEFKTKNRLELVAKIESILMTD